MEAKRHKQLGSFSLPLLRVLILGSAASAIFFGLIVGGPLDYEPLRRYCLSHPVAIASVSLFYIGLVGLALKWYQAAGQASLTSKAIASLGRLTEDGEEIKPSKRSEWLAASWQAQPRSLQDGWFGRRLGRIIGLQISRGRRTQLETDLKALSEQDADLQHESYSLLRIITWAMPMLGFLGTVLGISKTLGQLDTQMLATQQQEAMNQLTAGLYVAFDTTAIALVLTVISMFLQFAVSRMETNVLSSIDSGTSENLIGFLGSDPLETHDKLIGPIRELSTEILGAVHKTVEEQSSIWARSISESQRQWTEWGKHSAEQLDKQLTSQLGPTLRLHTENLERIHDESNRQLELRMQQWQTTLSNQARHLQDQQKEIGRQADLMQQLVQSTTDLQTLEQTIADSVGRISDLGRLEEAALCIGEAVAVLASSMERAGVIRNGPIRPRPSKQPNSGDSSTAASTSDSQSRKAA